LLAASADKLFIFLPSKNVLVRYDLATAAKEVAAPIEFGKILDIAIGSAAQGPLYALTGEGDKNGSVLHSVDALTLKKSGPSADLPRERRVMARLRVSANNSLILCNGMSYVPMRNRLQPYGGEPSPVYAMFPSPDGQIIYGPGGLYTPEVKPLGQIDMAWPVFMIPAVEGNYYLQITRDEQSQQDAALRPLSLSAQNPSRVLFALPGMNLDMGTKGRKVLDVDRTLFAMPSRKVVAIVSPQADEIVLHSFDVDEELKKADFDYFFAASTAPATASLGKTYKYPIQVKSRNPGVTFKLASGPPGAAVSADGKFEWAVPAQHRDFRNPVAVTITNAAGQELEHNFTIAIADLPEPAVVADHANPFQPAAQAVPGPQPFRTWKDASGKFEIEARYVEVYQDKVTLRKKTGELIEVAIERFRAEDQELIRTLAAKEQ